MRSGIFALRYVGSASQTPPRIYVEVSPSSREDVQVIFVPGHPKGLLDQPKHYALVVAEREGFLQLTVSPTFGSEVSARVQLEPLDVDAGTAAQSQTAPSPGSGANDDRAQPASSAGAVRAEAASRPDASHSNGFALTCHVAKRGDVRAGSGEWVGGPGAPSVIEGLMISADAAEADLLEYQVLVQGFGDEWSPWARQGQFAGSRGRSRGVAGLRVRLTDKAPANLELSGEAAFLGCPLIADKGRDLEFTSYAGVDPLVGLRLHWSGTKASQEVGSSRVESVEAVPSTGSASVLRVFKSKPAAA